MFIFLLGLREDLAVIVHGSPAAAECVNSVEQGLTCDCLLSGAKTQALCVKAT